MVHVVTGGGANQNPGPAGWGALIRQNGAFTWMSGHYDMASNNTMELQAVVEALGILLTGLWICV
jgi:ribonuclease HI